MEKIKFKHIEVDIVTGSSSLLNKGVLPVGGSRVPTLRDRYIDSNQLVIEFDMELGDADDFFDSFSECRIKSGCLRDIPNTVKVLLEGKKSTPLKQVSTTVKKLPKVKEDNNPATSTSEDIAVESPEWVKSETELLSANITKVPEECVTRLETVSKPCEYLNIFTMCGTSATGKGTRLSTFILFLINDLKLKYEYVSIPDLDKTSYGVGIYFKDLNYIAYGKWVRSNKPGRLFSWSSHDYLGNICIVGQLHKVIDDVNRTLDIRYMSIEGYPTFKNGRVWQDFHRDDNCNVHTIYLTYPKDRKEGFELMQQRVEGRSGSRIKGTCWGGNSAYFKWYEDHKEGISKGDYSGSAEHHMFDDCVSIHGCKVLDVMGCPVEIKERFVEFCSNISTIRDVHDSETNSSILRDLFIGQYPTIRINTQYEKSEKLAEQVEDV